MTDNPYSPYTTPLADIRPGVLFFMLNYNGTYMRVTTEAELAIVRPRRLRNPSNFNEDEGGHVPIVEMTTGRLFWMHKSKPCCTPCIRFV